MNVVNCNIWFILELNICKTNLKVLKHISHNTTSGIKVKMIPGTIKHYCDITVAKYLMFILFYHINFMKTLKF